MPAGFGDTRYIKRGAMDYIMQIDPDFNHSINLIVQLRTVVFDQE